MSLASQYTTETLVSLLKNLECVAASENTYTEAAFVQLMQYALQQHILPQFLSTNEEYFVVSEDFSVGPDTQEIEIPKRAIGMRARDVYWLYQGNNMVALPRIQPEIFGNAPLWGANWSSPYLGAGYGYYLKSNKIVFLPRINVNGTVRVNYFRRPNTLDVISNSGVIVSIDTNTNTVTLNTAPDTDTWDTGTVLDAIHPYQPFDFADEEITIVSRDGLDFTFSAEVVANLSVGDYLTNTGFSVFPQYLPIESHGVLVQATAMHLLQGLGDIDNYKVAQSAYNSQAAALFKMIAPRVQGQSKVIPRTGGGMFSGGYLNGGWYR